jgi:hypothetical protein
MQFGEIWEMDVYGAEVLQGLRHLFNLASWKKLQRVPVPLEMHDVTGHLH